MESKSISHWGEHDIEDTPRDFQIGSVVPLSDEPYEPKIYPSFRPTPAIQEQMDAIQKQVFDNIDVPDNNPKTRFGLKKPPFHLIPSSALVFLAGVMKLGARKYGPYNWRDNKVAATVYISAAQRHMASYLDGETDDPESGEPHLAHVMACCAIILDAMATGNLIDDRPKPGRAADLIKEKTTNE